MDTNSYNMRINNISTKFYGANRGVRFPLLIGMVVTAIMLHTNAFAQLDPIGQYNRYLTESWAGEYYRVGQYKVKGNPMFLGQAFLGTVKTKTVVDSKMQNLLYDLQLQLVGPGVNGKIYETTDRVTAFELYRPHPYGGDTLRFVDGADYGLTKESQYLNLLCDAPGIQLLRAYKIKVVPDPTNLMDKDLRVFEIYFDTYLFLKTSKELVKVKNSKKDYSKALAGYKNFDVLTGSLNTNFSDPNSVCLMLSQLVLN